MRTGRVRERKPKLMAPRCRRYSQNFKDDHIKIKINQIQQTATVRRRLLHLTLPLLLLTFPTSVSTGGREQGNVRTSLYGP